jgi:hypothetical protein
MQTYFLSAYPEEKTAELEETIRRAGYEIVPCPIDGYSNVAFLAEHQSSAELLRIKLGAIVHDIKLHWPK